MEAELTALREELSSRSKNNNGGSNGTKAEVANLSDILNGNENENSSFENASVIKKPEKNAIDVKEEDKNWFEFSQKEKKIDNIYTKTG